MPFKDPKKRLDASRKSREKKPEYYKAYAKTQGRLRSKRGYFLLRRYGLTKEDYEKMLQSQNGVCKICKNPPKATHQKSMVLHVDHDHITGKIRGLLCNRCNNGLGIVEQREFVKMLETYLEENCTTFPN